LFFDGITYYFEFLSLHALCWLSSKDISVRFLLNLAEKKAKQTRKTK